MSIEIVSSSPQALALKKGTKTSEKPASAYPFESLEVGQSFTVAIDACNWKSLRTIVYRKNREYKKADGSHDRKFAFLKHDDLKVVEVARIE